MRTRRQFFEQNANPKQRFSRHTSQVFAGSTLRVANRDDQDIKEKNFQKISNEWVKRMIDSLGER